MKKLVVLTIFATGYVLGAKAGRERYEQLRGLFLRVKNNPTVQQAAHQAADSAREHAPDVGHKLADTAGGLADRVRHGRLNGRSDPDSTEEWVSPDSPLP